MKCKNGKEVLKLLINSHRVFTDLKRMLEVNEKEKEEWKMNIILREFVFIEPINEFRGFVYEGKLVALSQYIDVYFEVFYILIFIFNFFYFNFDFFDFYFIFIFIFILF